MVLPFAWRNTLNHFIPYEYPTCTSDLSNPWHKLVIIADGKMFQVRAICHTTNEANDRMAEDSTLAVIDVDETTGTTILADKEEFHLTT